MNQNTETSWCYVWVSRTFCLTLVFWQWGELGWCRRLFLPKHREILVNITECLKVHSQDQKWGKFPDTSKNSEGALRDLVLWDGYPGHELRATVLMQLLGKVVRSWTLIVLHQVSPFENPLSPTKSYAVIRSRVVLVIHPWVTNCPKTPQLKTTNIY